MATALGGVAFVTCSSHTYLQRWENPAQISACTIQPDCMSCNRKTHKYLKIHSMECFYVDSLKPARGDALTGNVYFSYTLEDERV